MEEKFEEIAARYCSIGADEITDDMKFRDDLGMSSLDIMTFLGDLEDEFDVEFDFDENGQQFDRINTVGGAIELTKEYLEVAAGV